MNKKTKELKLNRETVKTLTLHSGVRTGLAPSAPWTVISNCIACSRPVVR